MKQQVDNLLAHVDVLPMEPTVCGRIRQTRHSAGFALPLVV